MLCKFLLVNSIVIAITLPAYALTDVSQFNSRSLIQSRPLYFTENKGQWDERVLFKADGAGGLTWWIERDGFTVLFSVADTTAKPTTDTRSVGLPEEMRRFDAADRYPNNAHALKFKFQYALSSPAGKFLPEQTTPATASSCEPAERLSWNNNYFLGNDQSKWAPDCGNFQRVVLKDVWDGVDVLWRGVGKSVEFDFVVTPGADASQIRVECLGLTGELEATADGGELLLPTSLGVLRQALPEAYQTEPDGQMHEVKAKFKVGGRNSFGITLPEGHDPTKPLIIDPLVYSTYLGGGNREWANDIALDGAGGVFVGGLTESDNFPTNDGAYDESFNGNTDAWVAQLNAGGQELIYCTYLGTDDDEYISGVASDEAGGVIVTGAAFSANFPTTEGAYNRRFGGGDHFGVLDAFVTKLGEDGSWLIFSTFLGGSGGEAGNSVLSEGEDGVVVVGLTTSADFPTTEGAFDRSFNGQPGDVFISRLSADGSELLSSTAFGGRGTDDALQIVPDGTGCIIIGGASSSEDLVTTERAFDRAFSGGQDGFAARFNGELSELIYCTYLGGDAGETLVLCLVPDGTGGAILGGYTTCQDFPTTERAYDRSFNEREDGFVTWLSNDGTELIYSTFIGGPEFDAVREICSDGGGGVVVAGFTSSAEFPVTEDAFQPNFGGGDHRSGGDLFISRLDRDGSRLLYSTFLGGTVNAQGGVGQDFLRGGFLRDGMGGIIVAGRTECTDFPVTEGAFQAEFGGGEFDVTVTRMDIGLPYLRWTDLPPVIEGYEDSLLLFTLIGERVNEWADLWVDFNRGNLPESVNFIDNGDGSADFRWRPTFEEAGNYRATFILSDHFIDLPKRVVFNIHNTNRAPSSIDLLTPLDGAAIPEDSTVTFAWSRSHDLDRDSLAYVLKVVGVRDSISAETSDTLARFSRDRLMHLLSGDNLRWEVWAKDGEDSTRSDSTFTLTPPLGVFTGQLSANSFQLSPAYPNPFNTSTSISYSLPRPGRYAVDVVDIQGRLVTRLSEGWKEAGIYRSVWNADNSTTGIYLVRLETPTFTATRKVTLLK